MQATHTDKIKIFHNINYCFTCGYDLDHPGNACLVADPEYHIPTIPHEEAHMYADQGASMVSHHKPLPDGTSVGMGWTLDNSISKAQLVVQSQKESARLHQQHQPYHPQQQQYCG